MTKQEHETLRKVAQELREDTAVLAPFAFGQVPLNQLAAVAERAHLRALTVAQLLEHWASQPADDPLLGFTDYTRRVVAVERQAALALSVADKWSRAGALVAMNRLDVEVPGFGSLPLFVVCVLGKQLDPNMSAEEMASAVVREEG